MALLLVLPATSAFAVGRTGSAHAGEAAPNPGQLSTLFKVDDSDPESTVPTPKQRIGNPVEFGYYLQDLLAKADAASKRRDQQRAIKYYRALAAAVPEQAQGWSLLCEAYDKAGDRERALRACQYAIDREGAELKDYHRFVDVMVAKPDELSADEQSALKAVLEHLDKQADLALPTAHMRCQSAVKTKDRGAMEACTAVLAKAAPNDPKTIVFQWSLAVIRGDRKEAADLLSRAEQVGVASESIERMSKVAISGRSSRVVGAVLLGGLALLCAALVLVVARRRSSAAGRQLAP